MEKAIGGYFELELSNGREYHSSAIRINTARNAFEYILRVRSFQKVYLPIYCCDALLTPLQRLGVGYQFYEIDEQFEPMLDLNTLTGNDALLYINYFGLKGAYISELVKKNVHLVLDNAQAFFEKPIPDIDCFYSPRKFFGVPDGAYLYCSKPISLALEVDQSFGRIDHLLIRRDRSAEEGFAAYQQNEQLLSELPLMSMSELTRQLLDSIDYTGAISKRKENYRYVADRLRSFNPVHLDLNEEQVPMVYPFLTEDGRLREKLLNRRIYVASYWKEVMERAQPDSLEFRLAQRLIPIPIDQRYDFADLDRIINCMA